MSYGRRPPDTERMVSLKVDNLTYRTTPEDLRRAFDRYGDVGDVYIPRDRFSRESRGSILYIYRSIDIYFSCSAVFFANLGAWPRQLVKAELVQMCV